MITAVYAAGIALLFVALSVRTIFLRSRLKLSIGHGDHPELERAVRAHSNFSEYVPLALLLIYFLETQSNDSNLIHFLCISLVAGRCLHALGVSQTNEKTGLRIAGMAFTFVALISPATALIRNALIG